MKKIVLFLFLIASVFPLELMASHINAEQKIYTAVFHELLPDKNIIKIWTDDKEKERTLQMLPFVKFVKNKQDADILLIDHTEGIGTHKMKFVGSYSLLKAYKNDALGGFYWKKGRPNLLFLRDNLEKRKIQLSPRLQKYIEDTI